MLYFPPRRSQLLLESVSDGQSISMTCLNRTCLEVGSDTPEVVTDLELRQLAESYQQHHFVVIVVHMDFACQLHDDPTTESGGQNHIRMCLTHCCICSLSRRTAVRFISILVLPRCRNNKARPLRGGTSLRGFFRMMQHQLGFCRKVVFLWARCYWTDSTDKSKANGRCCPVAFVRPLRQMAVPTACRHRAEKMPGNGQGSAGHAFATLQVTAQTNHHLLYLRALGDEAQLMLFAVVFLPHSLSPKSISA